jgi:hypothetical protein
MRKHSASPCCGVVDVTSALKVESVFLAGACHGPGSHTNQSPTYFDAKASAPRSCCEKRNVERYEGAGISSAP